MCHFRCIVVFQHFFFLILCKIQNTIYDNDVSKSLLDVANFQNKKSSFNDVI